MRIDDLIVEVRDSNLNRVGQILESDLIGTEIVVRFNQVGSWRVQLPADNAMAEALRQPGAGIIVTGKSGVLLSGFMTSSKSVKTSEDPTGVWEISGVTDSAVLGQRIAYPTPTTADVTAQSSAYDVRTGKAETVMKQYITANIGSGAPTQRRITGLTVQADQARGLTVTGRARFDTLGKLLEQLAVTSGLGYDLVQIGSNLEFQVYSPVDRSATIQMDIDNNRLTKSEYSYHIPEATRVIVAGQGSGASRALIETTTSDSTTAETLWSRRVEVFKDARQTSDSGELTQAGQEVLAEKGKTIEAISVTPSEDDTMNYPEDWGLGDKVSVVVGDITIAQIVTEVAIVITDEGIKIGATVGNPVIAGSGDIESELIDSNANLDQRVSNLERNDASSGGGGGASLAIADNAPSSGAGSLWLNSQDGALFARYNDGNSLQWIQVNNGTIADQVLTNRVTAVEAHRVPTGAIMQWFTNTPPAGWIFCEGQSTSAFPALASVIGSTVPNLQTRVPVGRNSAGTGTFGTLGATGGAETHTLTVDQMPSHTHIQNAHNHLGSSNNSFLTNGGGTPAGISTGGGGYALNSTTQNTTATNQNTGGGQAHNNLQPYIVLNYIIKT